MKKNRVEKPVNNEKLLKNLKNTYTGLTINLPSPVVVKEIPAFQVKISKIEIDYIVDIAIEKKVVAFVKSEPYKITLWEGEAYDVIGQWTDEDVNNRILEIYK